MTPLPKRRSASKTTGEMFLRFRLDEQTQAVVTMPHAQEAMVLPISRISVIPNLAAPILGLFNRRSSLLWLVDLPEILGLKPLERHRQSYDVVLLKVDETPLAVAVQEIQGVVRFDRAEIKSPIGNFDPALTPYLQGWILQEQELLLVLDSEAIINAQVLTNSGSQSIAA
jgi:positive phototaxis protein PixI